MKATNSARFVCLVFAWYSVRAGYVQTRAEQPIVDDTMEVYSEPGKRDPGVRGCLASPPSSYNVRLQSIKTSGGIVYTRQLVTNADLPCFENSRTETFPNAPTIASCAEATTKKGLNSFSWESGACTAYLAWRPQKRADCRNGGSKVIYVVKEPLTPFGGGGIIVSGNLRANNPLQFFFDMSYRYEFCGFNSKGPKAYKLLFNGAEDVVLPLSEATYILNRKQLCSRPVNISLWTIDADGVVNSNKIQKTINGGNNNWYGLQSGGCVYDTVLRGNYTDALQYCKSMSNGSLFIEQVDGEALAFLDALVHSGFRSSITIFYVGLGWDAQNNWTWIGGLAQARVDNVWVEQPTENHVYGCGAAMLFEEKWWLLPSDTCDFSYPLVCYFPNP